MKCPLLFPSVLAGVFVAVMAAPGRANECDKLTYFTFSAPVALPGVTLPAGTYRFSNPDCGETQHILRVSSQDGSTVYGTFLAIPDERTTSGNKSQVVLGERPAGAPETVKAWFYRADSIGDELIYPKNANHAAGPAA
jgi:hypothetical protein